MTRRNATEKRARSLARPDRPPLPPRFSTSARYPFERRYQELDGAEDHPVDAAIRKIRRIASIDRKVLALSRHWQEQVDHPDAYAHYEDLRFFQRCVREEAFFDAGFEEGKLVGIARSVANSRTATAEGHRLATGVFQAVRTAKLPHAHIAAVLLELARAFVLGQRNLPGRRSRRRP
jgi:hypothetical protein